MEIESKLREYFKHHKKNDIHKWSHYFAIYEKFFCQLRDRPIVFLEIGVDRGGSLAMWKNYFHSDSTIVGVDINPECKVFENVENHCFIEIGDQSDSVFLHSLVEKYGMFDIILDDGSHIGKHQIASLNLLWKHVQNGGLYLVEDLGCSYWPNYGGGYQMPGTFIEHLKHLIDEMHSYFRIDVLNHYWSSSICGLHIYPGIAVFEKGIFEEPVDMRSNTPEYAVKASKESLNNCLSDSYITKAGLIRRLSWKLKFLFYKLTGNKIKYQSYCFSFTILKKLRTLKLHVNQR